MLKFLKKTSLRAKRGNPSKAFYLFWIASLSFAMTQIYSTAIAQNKVESIGRLATPEEVKGWNISIKANGEGLPVGSGTAKLGEPIYIEKCASCHGEFGEGAGRYPVLAGGQGSLKSHDPVKTVGSYWPYASTLMDYIYRAMPFGNAQSLNANELYAVTAYVLSMNDIIKDDFILDQNSFKTIKMPNEKGFFLDDREKSEKTFWQKTRCMKDCVKDQAKITGRAKSIDVTPDVKEKIH